MRLWVQLKVVDADLRRLKAMPPTLIYVRCVSGVILRSLERNVFVSNLGRMRRMLF